MAKILYEVKQNQNSYSQAFGKWYAQVKALETMNTRKLANHISEHGSIYTPDVVYGVLEKFRSCLVEMLLNSKKVKIEGLGTFYCTLENQKNGALKKEDYNPNKHMKALHIRFLPEQTTEENISSCEFLKKAEFINVEQLLKGSETENGGDSTGENTSNGNGSQNSGSNTGSNSGNQSGNGGNTNTGGDSGSNSGSNTGGNQSSNNGSQSGSGDNGQSQQSTYNLTIARSGSGTSTVKDDSENVITGQRSFAPGTNLNIEIVPAEGQIPTARLNYNDIPLTENDGTYTGSFQMPAQGSVLELNSGSNGENNGGSGFDDGDNY